MRIVRWLASMFFICVGLLLCCGTASAFVAGHQNSDLADIPNHWITKAKDDLHIVYNHTSHGSQIISGIDGLEDFPPFGNKYAWTNTNHSPVAGTLSLSNYGIPGENDLSRGDKDGDGDGIADWAEDTYAFLVNTNNYHINVVMWSWCNIGGHNIPRYLRSMEWLIAQFSTGGSTFTDSVMTTPASPHARAATNPVKFVFMTGHANGGGEGDSSDSRNQLIRAHVATWNRILFDFSDLENYDPDNNYYLDKRLTDALQYDSDGNGSRDAYWSSEYLNRHSGGQTYLITKGTGSYGGIASCAHSNGPNNDSFVNCTLKGKAVWYLFARLAGWNGGGVTTYSLSVSKSGDGLVTSTPAGISCGSDCSEDYTAGTSVSLSSQADAGWNFIGWGGDCTGTGDCDVTMDSAKSVTAEFSLQGDLNGDNSLTLADVIVGLQVITGFGNAASPHGDVNGDGKIGMVEVLYLLNKLSNP